MAFVTITHAAKLVGKSKQTLYRHIEIGKLSRGSDKLIDTAELLRVYKELKQVDAVTPTKPKRNTERHVTSDFAALRDHIQTLQNDLSEIKEMMEQHRTDSAAREQAGAEREQAGAEREKAGLERERISLERERQQSKQYVALLEHKAEGVSGFISKWLK